VRCDLRGCWTIKAAGAHVVFHLFPARAAVRLARLSALDCVTEILEPDGQLRSVNICGIALGGEKLLGLEGAGLAVLPLGYVENHGMGVELGRGVAFNRAGRVVLEGRGGKLPRRLRRADVANSRLGIPLQLGHGRANALPVRHSYPVVAADQGGQ
jgi:hypothetical protein